jgi:hypothetical protein
MLIFAVYLRLVRRSPGRWWRGLDSNQRTLARADLQSAAFNHSATSPGAGRRAMWRAMSVVSTREDELSPLHFVSGAPACNMPPHVADGLERVKGIEPSS